jgi:hypothetical protein
MVPSAVIDELVQLVSSWQPDFAKKIVGAPAELIEQLEARLIAPLHAESLPQDFVVLPPEHRAFLERMGESSDGINSYGDDVIDLRCAALLEFLDHEDIDYRLDPRQLVLCGAPHDLLVWPLVFDRRAGVEPPPLVRFGGFDEENDNQALTMREHPSFTAMLFMFAFIRKCLPRFDWERELRSPGTKQPQFPNCPPGRWLPHFSVIIRQLGITSIAQTGPGATCAERAHAAVMMYECPGYTPDVRVAGQDRVTLNKVVEVLCDNLELFPYSLRQPA